MTNYLFISWCKKNVFGFVAIYIEGVKFAPFIPRDSFGISESSSVLLAQKKRL